MRLTVVAHFIFLLDNAELDFYTIAFFPLAYVSLGGAKDPSSQNPLCHLLKVIILPSVALVGDGQPPIKGFRRP